MEYSWAVLQPKKNVLEEKTRMLSLSPQEGGSFQKDGKKTGNVLSKEVRDVF